MKYFVRFFLVPSILMVLSLPTLVFILIAKMVFFFRPKKKIESSGRTVLLTGGKMTKCLQLARMFHAMGDRVIVAETPLYKWCGTRFSNTVDTFHLIPEIIDEGEAYCRALIEIAEQEQVDLFVPVSSPKSALYEARAKPRFPEFTTVFQFDETVIQRLDDKHRFIQLAADFGLSVPESYSITSKEDLLTHDFTEGKSYILKKVDYDPVYRLDLRPIPHHGWEERVKSLPISQKDAWVLQEFIEGREVCTHTTTQNGRMNLYVCCDSSPFQVNYAMLDLKNVKDWVSAFVLQLNATGQISFDFIIQDDGKVVPIECNPRTHSAITLFHNQLSAATAYLEQSIAVENLEPNDDSGHTYWTYHEMYRLLTSKNFKECSFLTRRIWSGKEAIFQWNDPWPYFFNNHISIPYQIFTKMLNSILWIRIDFNIGKIIVPGGD